MVDDLLSKESGSNKAIGLLNSEDGPDPNPKEKKLVIPFGTIKKTIKDNLTSDEALRRWGLQSADLDNAIKLYDKTKPVTSESNYALLGQFRPNYENIRGKKYNDILDHYPNPEIYLNTSSKDIKSLINVTSHELNHNFQELLPADWKKIQSEMDSFLLPNAEKNYEKFFNDNGFSSEKNSPSDFFNYFKNNGEMSGEFQGARVNRGGDFWKEWTPDDYEKYFPKTRKAQLEIMYGKDNLIKMLNKFVSNDENNGFQIKNRVPVQSINFA